MSTTPEPTKGVPRIEGNPAPTLRADHNDLADYVRDHTGESFATPNDLPSTGNWTGRSAYVVSTDLVYIWKGASAGWSPATKLQTGVRFNDTTNSNAILVVRHGLGAIPNWAQITMSNTGVDAVSAVVSGVVWDNPMASPISAQLRFRNMSGAWLGNNKVIGYLTVGL